MSAPVLQLKCGTSGNAVPTLLMKCGTSGNAVPTLLVDCIPASGSLCDPGSCGTVSIVVSGIALCSGYCRVANVVWIANPLGWTGAFYFGVLGIFDYYCGDELVGAGTVYGQLTCGEASSLVVFAAYESTDMQLFYKLTPSLGINNNDFTECGDIAYGYGGTATLACV